MDKRIKLGNRYLSEGIKRDYRYWRFCWAREIAQNSLDAGATKIEARVDIIDGNTHIVWVDNGCGMDAETIESKLMVVGESDKPLGGTGGFGVAGLLIYFAQLSYTLRTKNCLVRGSGDQYGIQTGLQYVNGCQITVKMAGDEAGNIRDAIRNWCRFSTTKCEIYLDGEKLETLRMHRPKAETEWCKIYTHRNVPGYQYKIRVRVNKQLMFETYTSVSAHITVDIQGDSLKLLTSNRCGMTGNYSYKLDKLIEEIYSDPKKIEEACDHVTIWRGTEGLVRFRKPDRKVSKISLNNAKLVKDQLVAALSVTSNREGAIGIQPSIPQQVRPVYVARTLEQIQELIDGHDVVILNQTTKEIPAKWIPGQMAKSSYKLLNRWIRVVQAVGEIMERHEAVSIGWVFGHDVRAMHKYSSEHAHMILLNPIDIVGNRFKSYWSNSNGSFYELVACAVHEICHIDNNIHNTSFANGITYAMAKVMARPTLLKKIKAETRF